MANVTIYLPAKVEKRARKAAKASGISMSRWAAEPISQAVDKNWSPEFLAAAGAYPDFPSLEEIRSGYGADAPREKVD